MPEFIAIPVQTVQSNQNVLLTDYICGNCSIMHTPGSGLVTLRGITKQCRARFKVSFSGNIAVPTGGIAGAISLAIASNGEALGNTIMTVTPGAVESYFNIATTTYIDVPCDCCTQISVKNITATAVNVRNANLVVERVA